MSIVYKSWVSEAGKLTGTDPTYTLPGTASTPSGNQFFRKVSAAFTVTSTIVLTITSATGAETSVWTYTPGASGAAGTITRVTLLESSTGAAINWSGVTATINGDIPAPSSVNLGASSAGLIPTLSFDGSLDSSVLRFFGSYRTGNWYTTPTASQSGFSPADNQLYFAPFIVNSPHKFQNIGLSFSGSDPTASTSVRLGVFSDNVGTPGALIFDAGTASLTTSGSGNILSASAMPELMPGFYWLAFGTSSNVSAAGLTVAGASSGAEAFLQNLIGTLSPVNNGNINDNYVSGYWIGWTLGAFPSTYAGESFAVQHGGIPLVGLQA
jgi:hypothetical protein